MAQAKEVLGGGGAQAPMALGWCLQACRQAAPGLDPLDSAALTPSGLALRLAGEVQQRDLVRGNYLRCLRAQRLPAPAEISKWGSEPLGAKLSAEGLSPLLGSKCHQPVWQGGNRGLSASGSGTAHRPSHPAIRCHRP